MDADLERALRALEEAAEFVRTYRFEITDDYLRLVEQVEAMPQNQSGSDKTAVWPAMRRYVESFNHVGRRVARSRILKL